MDLTTIENRGEGAEANRLAFILSWFKLCELAFATGKREAPLEAFYLHLFRLKKGGNLDLYVCEAQSQFFF